MFTRSEILKAAWAHYRRTCRPGEKFRRDTFGFYLSVEWRTAKQAAMSPVARRAEAIKAEIALLPYKPFRVDIGASERALRAELASLAA